MWVLYCIILTSCSLQWFCHWCYSNWSTKWFFKVDFYYAWHILNNLRVVSAQSGNICNVRCIDKKPWEWICDWSDTVQFEMTHSRWLHKTTASWSQIYTATKCYKSLVRATVGSLQGGLTTRLPVLCWSWSTVTINTAHRPFFFSFTLTLLHSHTCSTMTHISHVHDS